MRVEKENLRTNERRTFFFTKKKLTDKEKKRKQPTDKEKESKNTY